MLISAGLYLAGLTVLWRGRHAIPVAEWSTALLLAVTFWPFMECWLSGQASAIGFAAAALALRCESLHKPFGAGLCLALCLYKPPLLVLLLPMLVITRRWRVLGGFAAGSLALAGVSLLAVGWRGCLVYAKLLIEYPDIINSELVIFPKWKFIDLNNFLGLLLGSRVGIRRIVWLVIVLAIVPFLVRLWWLSVKWGPDRRTLAWAATLTWTLVLNIHTGYYDAILAVPGLMITADVLYRRAGTLSLGFKLLLALLYVVPWFSQHLARWAGFQPFTLILIALGSYQLILARRDLARDQAEDAPRFHDSTLVDEIR